MMFLRFSIAGAIMLAWMAVRKEPLPRGKTLLQLAGMGGLGYFGQALLLYDLHPVRISRSVSTAAVSVPVIRDHPFGGLPQSQIDPGKVSWHSRWLRSAQR